MSSLECEPEGRVDVLRFLLADTEFQGIEEVNPRDETTQGRHRFARLSHCPWDLGVGARSKLRDSEPDSYRAIRRDLYDPGEVEPYHHPEERDLVKEKLEGAVITNLIPEELIVQILRVAASWEFAPDTHQGERYLSRHVP